MPERRRRRLVDKFQHKLIARMVLYGVVYQFTLWNFLVCWRLLESGEGNFVHHYGQLSREFAPMLLCLLILMPPLVWDAVKFYHRIAGPIFRIKRAIRDVADGHPLGYVVLRENDELKELQDDFNLMLDSLSRRGAVTLLGQTETAPPEQPTANRDGNGSVALEEEVSCVSR